MVAFLFVAAIMLVAALVFVLTPLLRGRNSAGNAANDARRLLDALNAARDNGILTETEYTAKRAELGDRLLGTLNSPPAQRSRSTMYAALGVALLLPCAAILLYRMIGEPGAVDGTAQTVPDQPPADHSQNMDQAIAKLAEKLKQNPQDAEGWTLLGRAYEATEHFDEARDALKHAIDLAPNDADVTIAYAEVLALSTPERRIEGEPRRLIETAMKTSPDNERGLWLLGISEYQQKKYDAAIALWNRLIGVLPKDSKTIASVKQEIAKAEAARDGKAPPPEEQVADAAADDAALPSADDASGPHLVVNVVIDPKLKDKLAPSDVLFVYAKAANGPPMPLAIQRMTADKLPTTVTLTDGMGMMPTMKLSQFPQVIVGARVSKSGNAIAQSGDLQVVSKPMDVHTTNPVALTIDQVVP
ncbi:MAG TPA: c-type cytochrome biogenesis protein CcmI [Rudaea sp.]|jgi:cytochrome c-type biogenesis protein CcmH|nr:c-type cytochrome biogenesis protein CcmI [Rudaea sp.]